MKDDDIMQTWQIFKEGIPRGTVERLAVKLGKHYGKHGSTADLIRRWCREPLSSDNEYGTGALNPLDRFTVIFEHFLVHNPAAAEMVIEYFKRLRDEFNRLHGKPRCPKECFAAMVREVGEVIAAAGTDASDDEIEREGSEAIAAIRELIAQRKRKREVVSEEC